jgi:Holliday junction resolvase-like predicted endonuclease
VTKLKPRQQGDIGELSAMEWLASRGAHIYVPVGHIYVPVGHCPDVDLIAEISGVVSRVEVKTSTQRRGDKWVVHIATKGGNQSWNGLVKYFDRSRCEFLFAHVGNGRRWFIPTGALDCESSLTLGASKYATFEIESGRPLAVRPDHPVLQSPGSPGEYRSGQTGCAVNAVALSFGGSNPPSPISSPRPVKPTNYERKPGQNGEALNQKRRLTIPQRPSFEAGFANGGRVRVRADAPGRLLVEQIELPDWAK